MDARNFWIVKEATDANHSTRKIRKYDDEKITNSHNSSRSAGFFGEQCIR